MGVSNCVMSKRLPRHTHRVARSSTKADSATIGARGSESSAKVWVGEGGSDQRSPASLSFSRRDPRMGQNTRLKTKSAMAPPGLDPVRVLAVKLLPLTPNQVWAWASATSINKCSSENVAE
eukprot:2086979-Pyramimonas_sp.AAC.1